MNWYHRFKPMLAADCSEYLGNLRYPLMGSFKIDGIRAVVLESNSWPLSRSLKHIPNRYTCEKLSTMVPELMHLDLELVCLDPEGSVMPFNENSSAIMTQAGEFPLRAFIHDYIDRDVAASIRYERILEKQKLLKEQGAWPEFLHILEQRTLHDEAEVLAFYEQAINMGYEGIMLKDPHGFYKFGRSTLKEGLLLKLKATSDSEAVVVGFEELQHNDNPAEVNELGYLERSSHKSGKSPGGTLGKLIAKDKFSGVVFSCGTGFTHHQRQDIWTHQEYYMGRIYRDWETDRKSTRLNSSHSAKSRMPSSA